MDLQQVKQRFGIIGNSAKLNYALQTAMRVASTELTVYIQGESGSGKESFSKIIHHLSPRKHGPFIAINCGALPEGTINSELFGHDKGAFTGAVDNRKGYFESANGGTIFLDEVGELPLETQSRLLRVLENGEFIRVGSSKVQKTDVRIITATNRDLMTEVERDKFREDLYYRLATLPIAVPPLRERPGDVALLFQKFAFDASEKYRNEMMELTMDAEQLLMNYRWPGNIRQLKNIAEQVSVLEEGPHISADILRKYLPERAENNLPALYKAEGKESDVSERDIFYKVLIDLKKDVSELRKVVFGMLENSEPTEEFREPNKPSITRFIPQESNQADTSDFISNSPNDTEEMYQHVVIEDKDSVGEHEVLSLEVKEEELIRKALLKNNGRRKKAAKELGISERTLYRKIKQYEIES
ncbi:sigma-54 dependent transcriptional regulator [Bacteroidia bacterium]|jgi:transcriptional regulator with PAS, ATPase and Fis domain|nr:sigma-54 dependent transcriptional regulator [Bacteroidia bacterium]MDC0560912.1 sigma-54 dependent transcriptional regulator [Bacteroidia bacterium]MDC3407057.1 sigma-54 dependent transcriptional regulator [Bacteroidia bacterium]CAI8206948.1 MAG: Transcriptional regulatory protein GlrR [Bacteroidia bacterium]